MELNIAATLKSLRKEMGITQEEFANAIGVTAQTVSKWERGEGYPDITFLPDIADYFNVTLDTLCGIDKQQKQEQIHSIINATSNASYNEGVKIAREGLAKFPHSLLLQNNLAEALMGATYEEIVDDYMKSFENYYGLTKESDPQKYAIVVKNNIDEMLRFIAGVDASADIAKADLAAGARKYLTSNGMTDAQVDLIVEYLGD